MSFLAPQSWTRSYRFRLGLGYLLVVTILALAWAWSLFGPLTNAVVREQQAQLQSVAQAGSLLIGESDDAPQEVADRLVSRTNMRVTVIGADGRVLADTLEDASRMENHADRPEVSAALRGEVGRDRRVSGTLGNEQLYVAVPATVEGERGVLRVALSLERIKQIAASSRRSTLLLLGAVLLASLAMAARLVSVASEPVIRLTRSAQAMAEGNLTSPVAPAEGELGVLSSALVELRDQMRGRVEQLEAEKRNLRSVLDGLQDAVLLLDGDVVALANSAAGRMFREPGSGWRGARLAESLPASLSAAIERLAARVRQAAAGPAARTVSQEEGTAEEIGPDASGRFLRVSVLPLDPRTLVVIADVTERARLDQVRRDFVANASHELKTPTAGIQLLAESAATAAGDGDSAQALAFVSQMKEEAARLRKLVLELLDLSRLEAAYSASAVTDVRAVVELAISAHGAAAREAGLSLEVRDDARGQDLFVVADPTDLAIALDNLLDNALKYTEKGTVSVALSLDRPSGLAVIAVRDTGIGISPEELPRIFERFYRIDRARSRERGGTGLGLSLVKHVVERSGGTLEVSSAPGSGSVFTMRLPLVGSQAGA